MTLTLHISADLTSRIVRREFDERRLLQLQTISLIHYRQLVHPRIHHSLTTPAEIRYRYALNIATTNNYPKLFICSEIELCRRCLVIFVPFRRRRQFHRAVSYFSSMKQQSVPVRGGTFLRQKSHRGIITRRFVECIHRGNLHKQ